MHIILHNKIIIKIINYKIINNKNYKKEEILCSIIVIKPLLSL